MPANAWLPPTSPGGGRRTSIRAEDPPLQLHRPPRPPAENPQVPSHRQEKETGREGLGPPGQEALAKETPSSHQSRAPDGPSRADPSSPGPHLGPQGRWLVRLTQPISPHVRAPLVQEGRVQDISEVSVQFPLGLCRDTAAGPRGQTVKEEEEKAGSRLRASGRPGLAQPENDKPGVGAGELSICSRIHLPTPPPPSQLTLILRDSAKRHFL